MKILYDCKMDKGMCEEYIQKFKDVIIERLESKSCKNRGKLWAFSASDSSIFIEDYHIMAGDPDLLNTQHPEMADYAKNIVDEIIKFAYEIAPKYRASILAEQSEGLAKYYTFIRN